MPLLPEPLVHNKTYLILETLRWSDWMPRPIPGQGGQLDEKTGDEILPAHIYLNEEK
jgi:hypothetical protein